MILNIGNKYCRITEFILEFREIALQYLHEMNISEARKASTDEYVMIEKLPEDELTILARGVARGVKHI